VEVKYVILCSILFFNFVVMPLLFYSYVKKKSKKKSRKKNYSNREYIQPAEHYHPDFPEDKLPLEKDLGPWDYFEHNEKLWVLGEYTLELKPLTGEEREERIERREERIARQKKEIEREGERKRRARIKKNMEERKNKNSKKAMMAELKAAEDQLIVDLGLQKEKNGEQRKSKSS
tara:strand:- start:111 stop:635 length:525 start_codon:yes stop_codon:yes gene_type:complete